MYLVVLAGGNGTRLWPQSRHQRPKHLLRLFREDLTMLQETVRRVSELVEPDRVYVVTNALHADEVREQLPDVPSCNVLTEPVGRNSGPAVGYAAAHVNKRDPDEPMLVLSADHVILKEKEFRAACCAGLQAAQQGYLVTLGITPQRPETRYGYMELGEELGKADGHRVYKAARFTEKPDLEHAIEYVTSGRYVWNGGIFMWTASAILGEMSKHMPDLYSKLTDLERYIGTDEEPEQVRRVWSGLEDKSIDYGVLEQSDKVVTIPVDIGWSDIGDWSALSEFGCHDQDGNVIKGDVMAHNTRNSLIYSSGRLVAAVGLEDIVIVETEDAVLVCPKSQAQEVRHIVARLKAENREKNL